MKNKKRSEAFYAVWFLIPGMLFMIVFVFYPIIFSIPLAFFDYSIIGETKFVGLDNFVRAFKDPDFKISIINSIKYVISVPIIQIFSIFFAILLNRKLKGIKFFRATYYMPVVTSMVAVSIIWGWLYNEEGIVNYLLLKLGIIQNKISWLVDAKTALWAVMFVTIWKGIGYYMMIYLAGLQSIPKELEEAAMVDGANKAQTIFRIIMPLLKPYIMFCSIISLISAIRVFDEVYVLTQGGPGNATMTTSLFIYQKAFQKFDFGYASAIGLIVSVIITILTLASIRVNKKGGENVY